MYKLKCNFNQILGDFCLDLLFYTYLSFYNKHITFGKNIKMTKERFSSKIIQGAVHSL